MQGCQRQAKSDQADEGDDNILELRMSVIDLPIGDFSSVVNHRSGRNSSGADLSRLLSATVRSVSVSRA